MDVKTAVQSAKSYISDLFSEEQIRNVGLEEVEFDEAAKEWRVTVGFQRPWDTTGAIPKVVFGEARSYKVVCLRDADGQVIFVRDRQVAQTA